MLVAADRAQARVVLRYIEAFLDSTPMLARLVERRTAEAIDLSNGVSIEVHTASYRTVRGRTVVAAVLDELAFWRDTETSSNPASEIIGAIRPAMATVPGALLLAISSPYAKKGAFYEAYAKHFGRDGDVALWQAPTVLVMNPTIDRAEIERAYAEDDVAARAEWGGIFRSDLEDYVPREVVDRVTVAGRLELPPVRGLAYFAFADPSGGARRFVHDCDRQHDAPPRARGRGAPRGARVAGPLRARWACRPDAAMVLSAYGVKRVTGDRYAGEWVAEAFRRYGVRYEASERSKSEIFLEALPLLNAGRVELLDLPRLKAQLCGLERRVTRVGRDIVDHAPGAHDDVANAVAGALVLAAAQRPRAVEEETLEDDRGPRRSPPLPAPTAARAFPRDARLPAEPPRLQQRPAPRHPDGRRPLRLARPADREGLSRPGSADRAAAPPQAPHGR